MSLQTARDDLRARGFRGLRVVGDVHGDARAFAYAIRGAEAEGLFVLQLGDLTDYGPDSPEALRLAFSLLDTGRGRFLLGNHDHKLRRALTGGRVRVAEGLGRTLAQLEEAPDGEALARLPDKYIHRPWEAPEAVLRGAGVSLGHDYPLPVVEHAAGRRRALEAFAAMREAAAA